MSDYDNEDEYAADLIDDDDYGCDDDYFDASNDRMELDDPKLDENSEDNQYILSDEQDQQKRMQEKQANNAIVVVREAEDIMFDAILKQNSPDLVKVQECIMSENDIELCYLRIAKLLNYTLNKVQDVMSLDGWKNNEVSVSNTDFDSFDLTSVFIDISLRFSAVFTSCNNGQLTKNYQIDIKKEFTKFLANFISIQTLSIANMHIEENIIFCVLMLSLKKLLVFCLNIPTPFVGEQSFNAIVNPLYEEMKIKPTAEGFEIMTLALFANPEKMQARLGSENVFQSYFESYLQGFQSDDPQKDDCRLLESLAKLFLFINSTQSPKSLITIDKKLLESVLYRLIDAQLKFHENDQMNLLTPIQKVIDLLIQDISRQSNTELSRLKKLPMLTWSRSLPWISIAILPTLNTSDLKFISSFITVNRSLSEIKEGYAQLESAAKEQVSCMKSNYSKCFDSELLNRRECLQVNTIVQLSIDYYKSQDLRWNKIFTMQAHDPEINRESKERLHQAILGKKGVLFILELTKERAPSQNQPQQQDYESIKILAYLNGYEKQYDVKDQNKNNEEIKFLRRLEQKCNDYSVKKTKIMSNKNNFYMKIEGPMMWYQQSNIVEPSFEAILEVQNSKPMFEYLKSFFGKQGYQGFNQRNFVLKEDRLIFYSMNTKLMEIKLGDSDLVNHEDGNEEIKENDENVIHPHNNKVQWKRHSNDEIHGYMIPQDMTLNRIEIFEVGILGRNDEEYFPIVEKVKLNQDQKNRKLESDSQKEFSQTLKSLLQDQKQKLNFNNDQSNNENKNRLKLQEENYNLFASLDARVQDRLAPQIRVLGLDSLRRQSEASVLIVGMNHIGVEIAKNVAMSGVKTLGLCELISTANRKFNSLGQFGMPFKEKNDYILESNIIDPTVRLIQDLNEFVKCYEEFISNKIDEKVMNITQKYTTVVLVNPPYSFAIVMADACQRTGTTCITVDQASVYARVINQFPPNFTVADENGITYTDYMIGNIEQNEGEDFKGFVTIYLKKGQRHNLKAGSEILLREIIEKSGNGFTSWNQKSFIVMDSMDQESFRINVSEVVSSSGMSMALYLRNGIASEKKIQLKLNQEPYFNQLTFPKFDEQLSDDTDLEEKKILNLAFLTLSYDIERNYFMPEYSNKDQAEKFFENFLQMNDHLISEKIIPEEYLKKETINKYKSKILLFAKTCKGYVPAQGSVVGGVVAQEVMKSITKKWKPIDQTWIYNCEELLEKNPTSLIYSPPFIRLSPLQMIVGDIGMKKIATANTFVVGAGAIGGELIKNLAMNGFSVDGYAKIIVTDPKKIKNQNLSRSFLFREKHVGKSKSNVSVASAILMNHDLLDHIEAKEKILNEKSENEFSDEFFKKQNIVLSALDNLATRQYVKARCVKLRVKMVDSGTLGPKGQVQVVVPDQANSDVDQIVTLEGEQSNQIFVDQSKRFPESKLDCLEWAKDQFGLMFKVKYQSFQLLLDGLREGTLVSLEEEVISEALACLSKIPRSFNDCLEYAIQKFHKLFNLNVKQLLQVYPPEHKLADGSPFWTFPRRSPVPLVFTPENTTYAASVIALAKIRAKIFRISFLDEKELNINELRKLMESKKLLDIVNKNKANNVHDQMEQEAVTDQIEELQEKDPDAMYQEIKKQRNSKEKLIEEVLRLSNQNKLPQNIILQPQQFKLENQENFLVDFLHTLTNCRVESFRLQPIERIDVKIKVGKITPELITTTAIVAGLQTIEAMKLLLGRNIGTLKNSLVDVSALSIVQTSPIQEDTPTDRLFNSFQ